MNMILQLNIKLMKKLFLLALISVFCFSCKNEEKEPDNIVRVDFSDVTLPEKGYLDAELKGQFISNGVFFVSEWNPDYGGYSDGGIYPSNLNDSQTRGIVNQYSAFPKPDGKFAVVHYSEYIANKDGNAAVFFLPKPSRVLSLKIANSTYTYWSIKDGDDAVGVCRPYGRGDYFKVIFKGFDINGVQTSRLEHYLADFRDGKIHISSIWEEVDLSSLGEEVSRVEISMDGTDRGGWGLNTPTYCCIDDIKYLN